MRLSVACFPVLLATLASACAGDSPPASPSPAPPPFHHVEMEGGSGVRELGVPGASLQLRASAVFEDGSRSDVTAEAAWNVNDPGIATVSARGLVTAVGPGMAVVTATYRNRSSVANLRVAEEPGRVFDVTGVVRGGAGAPLAEAVIRTMSPGQQVAYTDGNGYFHLRSVRGAVTLLASALGHDDASVTLPTLAANASIEIRLAPHPGAYVERTVAGTFEARDDTGAGVATLQISTRRGGAFDAQVVSDGCDVNGWLSLTAESGGVQFAGTATGVSERCHVRLRFVAPESRIGLTIRGHKTSTYRLRFREPA